MDAYIINILRTADSLLSLGGLGTGETLHMSQPAKSPLWIESPKGSFFNSRFEILCASALFHMAERHRHQVDSSYNLDPATTNCIYQGH